MHLYICPHVLDVHFYTLLLVTVSLPGSLEAGSDILHIADFQEVVAPRTALHETLEGCHPVAGCMALTLHKSLQVLIFVLLYNTLRWDL